MDDKDTNTPGQQEQDNSSGQQDSGAQTTDWESRFKGLQRKYNTLMEAKGELEKQLEQAISKIETLEKASNQLSVEKDSLLKENQTKIDELTQALSEKDQKLSELSQVQLKVKVANELGHPELVQLIDAIPNSDDPEQVKESMQTILGFTKAQIERREQQLTEGLMPGEANEQGMPQPTTEEGWLDLIEKYPLGSDEYNNAMEAYFNWTNNRQ